MAVLNLLVACVVAVFCVLRPLTVTLAEQSDFAGKIFPTDRLDENQVFGEVVVRQGALVFVSGGLRGGKARVLVYRELRNGTAPPLFQHIEDLVSDKDSDDTGFASSIAAGKGFVAVGAPTDNTAAVEAGKVFVYDTDVIASSNNSSEAAPPRAPPRPIVLSGEATSSSGGSAFRERFGSSLSAGDDVIVVGAPASSFGSAYVFRRDSPPNRWKVVGRLRSPFFSTSSSALPSDRFGEVVQVVTSSKTYGDVRIAVGAPGFSPSPARANSGAVFVFACSALFINKPALTLLDSLYSPDNDNRGTSSSSSHFFGHNLYLASDVAFVAALTSELAGVVHYYEKDPVTSFFVWKESLTSALPRTSSITPSLPFLDHFGSSLLSIQATIKVSVHVRAKTLPPANTTSHTSVALPRRNLRQLQEEEGEGEEDSDVTPSTPPSPSPTTSPTNTSSPSTSPTTSSTTTSPTVTTSITTEHPVSLLLVGAPSTSFLLKGSGGKVVFEGGVVYVFSNHRHVIRNLTCTSSVSSDIEEEVEAAYRQALCRNTSSLGDWEVVGIFSADIAQAHGHYGSQITGLSDVTAAHSLLVSAPFALPLSTSSSVVGGSGSGVVYVDSDTLRHTLSQLGDDVSRLLNRESSEGGAEAPSGAGSGDDVFSGLWRALTSTDGVIVTATLLPALLIAALSLYLYLRPPPVGGAYSKMTSPSTTLKEVKMQSEEEGEVVAKNNNLHYLVHSLATATAMTSLHPSENNEEVTAAPPSRWRVWWQGMGMGKYDELNTASDVIASSPPRSSSSHSTPVRQEEVEERIYDASYPVSEKRGGGRGMGKGRERWTSNPLHSTATRHSTNNEEESHSSTTSALSSMTHFLGQWAPRLPSVSQSKEAEEEVSQTLPR